MSLRLSAYDCYYIIVPLTGTAMLGAALFFWGSHNVISPVQIALVIICLIVSAGSSFMAYFEDRVHNGYAWAGILTNGLIIIALYAMIYRSSGIICAAADCTNARIVGDKSIYSDMVSAIYFSTVTFTTLGFGDLQPVHKMRLAAASEAVIGYLYLGFLVGAAFHWASQPKTGTLKLPEEP